MGGGSFGGFGSRTQQPRQQQPQYQAWPGYGMGGMPGRHSGLTGYQSYGAPGAMFGGYSGGNMMYGPGSWSSPGAMPYGGGSGMFGGGSYNTMANQMAALPPRQPMATPTRGGFGGKGGSPMGGYQPVIQPPAQPRQAGPQIRETGAGQRQVLVPGVGWSDWGDVYG